MENSEEQSGRMLDQAPDLIPGNPPKKTKRKSVCGYMCMCGGEGRRGTLVKNSQRGKSLNYSLKKPAVETSTHPSEAEGSKHSLTSNSASAQLLTATGSRPTGKWEPSRMNFLYSFTLLTAKAQVCLNLYLSVCVSIYDRDKETDTDKPRLNTGVWGDCVFPVPLSKRRLSAPQTLVHIEICGDQGTWCIKQVCLCEHRRHAHIQKGNWSSPVAISPTFSELGSRQKIRQLSEEKQEKKHFNLNYSFCSNTLSSSRPTISWYPFTTWGGRAVLTNVVNSIKNRASVITVTSLDGDILKALFFIPPPSLLTDTPPLCASSELHS